MGKASKWIRNLLMGKKEDKKKNDTTFSIEYHTSETQDETPKVRRKWSFRKFAGRDPNFKLSSSNSFESADTPKLRPQVFLESTKSQQKHHTSLAVTSRDDKNAAAATKIQAVFRSFLARKALHALKGLVKLQALFRGHLVRKQTASTLRGMHALMAIQVRARVQRIQLAEETESSIKTQSSNQNTITQESKVKDVHQRPKNNYQNETRSPVSKSTSGYLNHYEINKKDAMSHSGPLSISKQHQYEESCFTAAGKSPLNYPSTMIKTKSTGASMIQKHPNCAERMSYYNYLLLPNYMAKTESSSAKVRSQSEPKQRPKESKKQKSKHIETTDGVHAFLEDQVLESSTSQFKFNGVENYDPLFKKLYRNGKSLEDNKYDSISTTTSQSNYYEYLATYEANWSIY